MHGGEYFMGCSMYPACTKISLSECTTLTLDAKKQMANEKIKKSYSDVVKRV